MTCTFIPPFSRPPCPRRQRYFLDLFAMSDTLISPPILFRFAAPCAYTNQKWSATGIKLTENHKLPCFAELAGKKPFADLRLGWNEHGIAFNLNVTGKQQPPWCRDSRIDDSDGLQLFIDTRNTQ